MRSIHSSLTLCVLCSVVSCGGCQTPVADLVHTQGTVQRSSDGSSARVANSGGTLGPQEWLMTKEDGRATFNLWSSKTTVELQPNSVIILPTHKTPMSLQAGQANISATEIDMDLSGTHVVVQGVATIRRSAKGRVEVDVSRGNVLVDENGQNRPLEVGKYIREPGGTFRSLEPEPEPEAEPAPEADPAPVPEPYSLVETTSATVNWSKTAALSSGSTGVAVEITAPKKCGKKGKILLIVDKKPKVTSSSPLRIQLPTGEHLFVARCRFGRARMQLRVTANGG